jgi:SAM-dependent methyltransferase
MNAPQQGVDPARARSFDAWAGEYDRYRPGYPDELFEAIAEKLGLPVAPLVVDLGAGTGRASLGMAALGWRVTAVEPGKPMLDVLRAHAANDGLLLSTVQGTAEATGLDPDSADLVTAAQAFHWFEMDVALTEIARILKPGGGVALFWNVRDTEASPFLRDYNELLVKYAAGVDTGRYEATGKDQTDQAFRRSTAFTPPELIYLRHAVAMTATEFMGMAFTASYVSATMSPDQQDRFRIALAGVLGRHGHNDDRPFDVPYRVDAWIARRRSE